MSRQKREMPEDFATHAKCEGDLRLRARYGANGEAVKRWRAECGVYCGAPRGKRSASRSTAVRQKPYRARGNPRYTSPAMAEISWYDGEDDVGEFMSSSGISAFAVND